MNTGKKIEYSASAHFSLKRAWEDFKDKDPVDAYYDALTLVQACRERLDEVGIKCVR